MRIKCSKCGKKRDVSKFSRRIGTPLGYKSACKECRSKTEIYNNPKVTERARLKYRKSVKGIQKEKEYSTSEKHYKAVKKWAKKNTKTRGSKGTYKTMVVSTSAWKCLKEMVINGGR